MNPEAPWRVEPIYDSRRVNPTLDRLEQIRVWLDRVSLPSGVTNPMLTNLMIDVGEVREALIPAPATQEAPSEPRPPANEDWTVRVAWDDGRVEHIPQWDVGRRMRSQAHNIRAALGEAENAKAEVSRIRTAALDARALAAPSAPQEPK